MKNFKNTLTNKNSNSNRKPHYKAISLASLSTLALTLTLGDVSTANAMMTKTGTVKFYGSNGNRVISAVHNKISSSTTSGPLKVGGDIAGRFTNTSKIGTTSTTTSKTTSTIKTYKSTLNINLKGNTSGLGSSSSSTKKPTTTTINKNTSSLQQNTGSSSNTTKKPTTTTTNKNTSSLQQNTGSSSTTSKKPTTTTTQPNIKYTKDGTPYVTENGENYIYVNNSKGQTKINMDFNENGDAIYYTKNASGTITYLQKVGQDNGEPDFRPTTNNKPVVSVGTQTNPDIDGTNTGTLTSKKPTTQTNQFDDDGIYNATLVQIDDDGNIIQQNNSGSTTLKPTTGNQQSSTQINDDVDGINKNTLTSKKPTATGQFGDEDVDGVNNNTLTSKKPTTTNQLGDDDSVKNNTLVQVDEDGDGQLNNAGAPNQNVTFTSSKLTKKQKIALGVAGGVAGLGTIIGLSVGLTSNGNGNKNNEDTPPKLVPVPNAPKHSISVVSSPDGFLFTDS